MVEAKLSALITRLDEAEKRVEFLEGAEKELQTNPPATKAELELIWDKIEDMENRKQTQQYPDCRNTSRQRRPGHGKVFRLTYPATDRCVGPAT